MEHKLIRTGRGALSNMDRDALARRRSEQSNAAKMKAMEERIEVLEKLVQELREQNG